MGELRQRGRIWWIRYYRNGRRYEESSGSEKKAAAIDLLKIREGDGARGVPVTPKIGRLRFEEAAADVIADYRVNGKRSLEHAERRINLHLNPFFGGRRMTSITTADVRAFIDQRQAGKASNGEVNRELALLKRMFTLALQAAKLLVRPHIPMLKESNVRSGFFERETFEAVRAHLPAALQPVMTFAYVTGWRVPSEILSVQWRQVDFKAGTVTLDPGTTKNDEARVFPFAELDELRDLLEAQRARTEQVARTGGQIVPWVFHRNGKAIRNFRRAWASACEAAGCPDRIPHDFRRTAVRNLVRAGVPERVAMQMTGHKTRSVFERYNIVSPGDLVDAAKKLNAALTGTKQGQSARSATIRRFRKSS